MKRPLVLFFIAYGFLAKSQNYIISALDTVKYGACYDLLLPSVTFSNTTSGNVYMHMERIVKNIPSGWTSCFCYPECLTQTQSVHDFTISSAGKGNPDGIQLVAPNFGTDSIPGIGEIIVVFNEIGVNKFDTLRFRGITSKFSGVNEFQGQMHDFKLYPNPASRSVTLSYKQDKQRPEKIELYSVRGEKIRDVCYSGLVKEEIVINIEDLVSGVYYLKVNSSASQKILKFAVSN